MAPDPTDREQMRTVHVDIRDGENAHRPIEDGSDGELLEFPPGRFSWPSKLRVVREDWGITGAEDGETVFVVPNGYGTSNHEYVLDTAAGTPRNDNAVIENITFDTSGDNRANPGVRFECVTRGYVGDLTHACDGVVNRSEHTDGLKPIITDPGGSLTVRRYTIHNNGRLADYNGGNSRVGIASQRGDGEVLLEDCRITGCPNNGVYARMPGVMFIEGGLYGNNNVSQIRFAGENDAADGVTLFVDEGWYEAAGNKVYRDDRSGNYASRLLWNDTRGGSGFGGVVRNSTFLRLDSSVGKGHIEQLDGQAFSVRSSQFLMGDSNPALVPNDGPVGARNCVFVGRGDLVGGNGNAHGIDNVATGNPFGPLDGEHRDVTLDEFRIHPDLPKHSSFEFESGDGPDDDRPDGGDDSPDHPPIGVVVDRIDHLEEKVDSLEIVVG